MQYIVNKEFEGVRLDRWLRRSFEGMPQSLIEKYLRNKDITLNGLKVKSSHKLTEGDVISLNKHIKTIENDDKHPTLLNHKDYKIIKDSIIFENGDYVVFNKPAGFAVQGGTGVKKSIIDILKAHDPDIDYKIVHRIDKATSGILIVAKTYPAARYFADLFASHNIMKTYMAIIDGSIDKKQGRLENKLLKMGDMVSVHQDGKEAITDYKIIHTYRDYSMIQLRPLTGRMHQLRVQLAYLGKPIKGDDKYNPKAKKNEQLFLHAYKIEFLDLQKKTVIFKADIPSYFKEIFPNIE
jgi:23S rRNA pseudouridine955/2504/2580 synthase